MAGMERDTQGTRVKFVGGNNDVGIGANCMIVENTNEQGETTRIMIDLGMKLTVDNPEYDGIIPDIRDYLDKIDDDGKVDEEGNVIVTPAKYPVKAIFITHAHDDHKGGFNAYESVGYKLPTKISGEFTIKHEKARMARENINPTIANPNNLISFDDKEKLKKPVVGFNKRKDGKCEIEVEAFAVSHSAVNAKGFHVLVRQPDGNDVGLVFTGDFNMREMQATINGKQDGFKEDEYLNLLSRKPVTHIFHDSTSTGSSNEFIFDKETCINEWVRAIKYSDDAGKKEIFTESIANSVEHKVKLLESTRRYNAKYGRNKQVYIDGIGSNFAWQAYIDAGGDGYEDVLFRPKSPYNGATEFKNAVPEEDRIIDMSGVFAEGAIEGPITKLNLPSGMVKLSNGEKVIQNSKNKGNDKKTDNVKAPKTGHRFFQITPDSTAIKAQRDVGINSFGIRKTWNKIGALGAMILQVNTYDDAKIGDYPTFNLQSSGHASTQETQRYLDYHNPTEAIVIPVHGDTEQLKTTAKVANGIGFKADIYKNANVIGVYPGGSYLIEENDDENIFLAFRNEGTVKEKTLVVDEVQVIPDDSNKTEYLIKKSTIGKYTATRIDGKWIDKKTVEESKDRNGKVGKKQLRKQQKQKITQAYFDAKKANKR